MPAWFTHVGRRGAGPSWENGGFNRTSSAQKAEAPSGWQVAGTMIRLRLRARSEKRRTEGACVRTDPEAAAIAALWMSERESGLDHMREQGLDVS